MRKLLLSILLLFIFSNLHLWSKQIDQEEAKRIAENFINNQFSNLKKSQRFQLQLVYTAENEINNLKKNHSQKYYYVYNIGANQGFIIISADDINYPIIGYANSGYYDAANLPDNFQSWMKTVELGMQQAFDNSIKPTKEIEKEWELYRNSNKGINTRITPLQPLLKTKWNQDEPYNSQIPYKVYTGCVATATAQIMKFYQYPNKGIGIIPAYQTTDPSNNAIYNIPQIDLQQYEYDWSNMLNEYYNSPTTNYTNEQAKAVGLLMYHIGASAQMKYGVKASGTSSEKALKSLYTYFGYDKSIDYIIRGRYYNGNFNEIPISDEEWNTIIIKELNEGRPVYYSGSTENRSGHAFVCDGYDSNGLLHFNFGWGGYQDGYYNSNAPLEYKYGQSIGINIKPNEGGEKVNRYFVNKLSISKNKVYKDECFVEKHDLYNISIEDTIIYKNQYMALYDLNNTMVTLLDESNHPYNYNNNYYTLNSTIKAGKYRLKVVEKKGEAYIPVKTAQNVDDTSIIELLDGVKSHNLNLLNNKNLTANIRQAKPKDYLRVEFSFENNRCKPFNGKIVLALTNEKDELQYILRENSVNNFGEGHYYGSYIISGYIPDDIVNGAYRIRIFARENDGQEWQFLEGATVNYLPLTIVNGKLGIEELKNKTNEFVIYPNPVKDILYIKSYSEQQIKSISIFDLSGKEVLCSNIDSSNEVNVSSLSSGAYIIKIQTSKEIMKYKFIKK
ncbi:T9SS type A sorting domain-containing protein [Apibacter sp. B3706]|uniref:thiol protease/hemagglutinin PrtT n=1 Tax=Apibacter sp. B3706 TaxID=2656760 RepID=UPI00140A834E|nr:thiol protease/hemagglutinin PrtT [Apibacter sp. B3706]QII71098.1 T9SS type A sorting domain-containing protein [Apibacter sp. B3706]